MGCFLACFGLKDKTKKRRKPGKKCPSGERDHQSYVPLDSDDSIQPDIKENIHSDSNQLKEQPKEPAILKIKKKVSFNLNVKAYEPIPDYKDDDLGMYLSEDEEDTKWELNNKETKNTATLHYEEEDTVASSMIWPYPATHRYHSCRDSYEDEDNELMLDDNDLNFDDIDAEDEYSTEEEEEEDDDDNWMPRQEDFTRELKSDKEVDSKSNARDRSGYVLSVLNPVENLSQWKRVKAKEAAKPVLTGRKENSDPMQESASLHAVAVDASLSNWMERKTTFKI